MNTHRAPSVFLMSLAASGHYRLHLADETMAQVLALPPEGDFDSAFVAAGLPPLCVERLGEVLRSGVSSAWRISMPGPDGRPANYMLAVSQLAVAYREPGAAERRALVSLAHVDDDFTPPLQLSTASAAPRHVQFTLGHDHEVLSIDTSWTALTGHAVADTLGRQLPDFMPAVSAQRLQRVFEQSRHGTPDLLTRRQRQPLHGAQGEILWVELGRLEPVHGDAAVAWRGSFTDVTDNVRNGQLYRLRDQALDLTAGGIVVIDATQPHKPMVLVNRKFTEITGYAEHEVLGRSFKFFQGMENHQDGAELLAEAIREGKAGAATLANFRKAGQKFWNQISVWPVHDAETGLLTHFIAVMVDVSETRELIGRLSRQADMLHAVHHDNPNGVVAFDGEGLVCLQNAAFKALTGVYAVGQGRRKFFEMLGALCHDRQLDIERELERAPVLQCRLARPKARVVEIRKAQENMADRASLLVLRDVTAEVQLHEMQREFLATAAHELRTPMGSIQGYSGLILTQPMSADTQRDLVERIHQQSLRLSQLLNDLLDLSRIESQAHWQIPVRALPITPVVQEVVKTFGTPELAGRLELHAQHGDVEVVGHRGKLVQVLLNLISNALKYSKDKVTVSIAVDAGAGLARIGVRDRGAGMNAATLERLFTKFFRAETDDGVRGTGLGLYIARELTERMGGRIGVSSTPGEGSLFELAMPLSQNLPPGTPTAAP